jgi:hypothetical protein
MLEGKEVMKDRIASPPLIERAYTLYRDYVIHEDELINQRLTILIASQSILLAAFGYVLQKMVDSMPPFRETPAGPECFFLQDYEVGVACWLVLFAVFGLLLAYYSLRSILAARDALTNLSGRWQMVARQYDKHVIGISPAHDECAKTQVARWHHAYLPDLTGGGARNAHNWGLRMPQWVPISFLSMWGTMSLLTIGLGIHRGWIHCSAPSSSAARGNVVKDLSRL